MENLGICKYINKFDNPTSYSCLQDVLENICKEVLIYTKSQYVFILLYNETTSSLKPYIISSLNEKSNNIDFEITLNRKQLEEIEKKYVDNKPFKADKEFLKSNNIKLNNLKDELYINYFKIVVDDELVGTFNISCENEAQAMISEEKRDFIKFISKMVGRLIKKLKLCTSIQTENKKRDMLQTELDNYLKVSADLVSVYDLEDKMTRRSFSWNKVLGWEMEELNNLDYLNLIHEDDHEKFLQLKRYLYDGKGILHDKSTITLRNLCKDGSYRYITWYINYIRKSRIFISMGKDITDMVNAKRQNEKLQEDINMEISKNEFFANMSHELKTPLNILLSTIQVMQRNLDKDYVTKDNVQSHVDKIRQNSYRLIRLVNNLIDMNKMDLGSYTMVKHNHNIINIIENITMSVLDYVENKNISLVFDTDEEEVIISCSQDAIERIMLNLLSNAIKFVPPKGGEIYVNIHSNEEKILVSVKDNGIGIPNDKLDFIFDRFKQVDSGLINNYSGSGIGLYIVKTLVELHGGKIYVESEINKGSEFIFELPIVIGEKENINSSLSNMEEVFAQKCNIEFSDIYIEDN